MSTLHQQLADAYTVEADAATARPSRRRRLAETFRYSHEHEQHLTFRDRDPDAFDAMPTGFKISVASYQAAKEAAAAEGLDTGPSEATA